MKTKSDMSTQPASEMMKKTEANYWWEDDRTFTLFKQVIRNAWYEKEVAAKLLQGFGYVKTEDSEPPDLKSYLRWLSKQIADKARQEGMAEGAQRVADRVATMTNFCPIEGHVYAPSMCPHWTMAQQEAGLCAKYEVEKIKKGE